MDGMTALPLLLRADPSVRVVMASTLTTRGADIAMRALSLGASDYVPKPDTAAIADDSFRTELLAKVKGLARLRQRAVLPAAAAPAVPTPAVPTEPITLRPPPRQPPLLLAIGSSTGGPQALFTLVQGLGPRVPVPVVLTQHMPATFTPILAAHLTKLGGIPCAEARDGEALRAGHIALAPGDRHLIVAAGNAGTLRARVTTDPPENFCRPAVDPMLRSAVTACGGRVLMVMLTGMATMAWRRRGNWFWPAAPRSRRTRHRAWSGACPAPSPRPASATRCCRCRQSRRKCSNSCAGAAHEAAIVCRNRYSARIPCSPACSTPARAS